MVSKPLATAAAARNPGPLEDFIPYPHVPTYVIVLENVTVNVNVTVNECHAFYVKHMPNQNPEK